ncbi:MAG: MBL fold metallo-hydrolase [Nitrososphaeria archaeon]
MIDKLRIYVLNDNEGAQGFLNEWGLSLFVDAGTFSFLFDSDSSPRVIEHNSKQLGIDLSSISFFFLSHEHLDHLGGAEAIPEGKTAYVPAGTESSYLEKLRVIEVKEMKEIEDGVWSTGPLGRETKEQSMVVQGSFGYALLVGCSHPGIDFITERAQNAFGKLKYLIGGFHQPSLSSLSQALQRVEYASPIHCSGDRAKAYARAKLGGHYVPLRTGSIVSLDENSVLVERF